MSLYETLKVTPNADADDIKRAYRQRAKETHPDSGGDSARFTEICLAYSILSDPLKKRQYDESGTIDPLGNAIAQFAFDAIIAATVQLSQFGLSPAYANLTAEAANILTNQLAQVKQNRLQALAGLKVVAKYAHRFKTLKGETSLRKLLEAGEARHKQNYDTQVACLQGAIELLKLHRFERDESRAQTRPW